MYYFELTKLPEVRIIGQTNRSGFWRKNYVRSDSNMLLIIFKGECTFTM